MQSFIGVALRGVAMGMAEVVPGVSGGTIAFVTGIYERLLTAITAIEPGLLTTYRREGVAGVWKDVQGPFLVALIGGMAVGLVVGVFAITYLIEHFPPVVWAFFFGLIVGSAWYIGRMVAPWGMVEIVAVVAGFAIALAIVMGTPAGGNTALWFVFVCGAIAISAMLLPGISGSFILLLMGMYGYVIPSVKAFLSGDASKLVVVAVFGAGCLTGLATFSRLLKWLFEKFPQPTLALLTGFMLGSLYKLWPWRVVTDAFVDPETGERKIISESPVGPAAYFAELGEPAYVIAAAIAAVSGAALIYSLSRLEHFQGNVAHPEVEA